MAITRTNFILLTFLLLTLIGVKRALCIRTPNRISETTRLNPPNNQPLKTTVLAFVSFWRSESVFGCLYGVFRTTVGYGGGSKINPGYRSLGDHAELNMILD